MADTAYTHGMAQTETTKARLRWVSDIAIAVVLGTFGLLDVLTSDNDFPSHSAWLAVVVGASGYVLVLRRIRPALCVALSLGLLSTSALIWGSYQAGSTLLIAIVAAYSAPAYGVSLWLTGTMITITGLAIGSHHKLSDFVGGFIFVALIGGVAAAGGVFARKYRALAAAESARRELTELESESAAQAAVEEERARVARELHDILSHSLGVVVLQTGAAEHAWESDPGGAHRSVVAARQTALEAVDQLRALLSVVRDDLDGSHSPTPSLAQLTTLAERASNEGFAVQVDVEGEPRPVAPQLQASLYRVAQEGIANAMRHSGARGCRIRLQYLAHSVALEVTDDGRGRPSDAGSQRGLAGIRERAQLFGGNVTAGPVDAGGWRLAVDFPG